MGETEKGWGEPTLAFTLSLIGGLLILSTALFILAAMIVFYSVPWGMRSRITQIVSHILPGTYALPAYMWRSALIGVWGVICGLVVVAGALRLRNRPEEHVKWGKMVIIFSVLGTPAGGILMGYLLGLMGGILGLRARPSLLRKSRVSFFATVLSVLFTIAFFFLMMESVEAVDSFLINFFPDYGPYGFSKETIKMAESLRPFGYVAFGILVILILVGFASEKGYISSIGSIGLYLPVFGHFAFHMFFLAGLGVTRALWLPFFDRPNLMRLGHIALLPTLLFRWLRFPVGYNVGMTLSFLLRRTGVFIFFLGVLTWLYAKFKGYKIVDFWIYRYSRHPQYLGFLLWSYGTLILTVYLGVPRGGLSFRPSLPWLISTLAIIAVALVEEIEIVERHGKQYVKYRRSTPFMFPLPKQLSEVITYPMKILFKKNFPENKKEIACIISIYGVLLILPSVVYL